MTTYHCWVGNVCFAAAEAGSCRAAGRTDAASSANDGRAAAAAGTLSDAGPLSPSRRPAAAPVASAALCSSGASPVAVALCRALPNGVSYLHLPTVNKIPLE